MSPPDEAGAPPPPPDIWEHRTDPRISKSEEPPSAATYRSADHMPSELRDQLRELEEWALANKGDAARDAIAFWGLKLPAVLASASAGVLAHFELTTVSVFAGAIASLCIIIDGIHPRGMLRNTHLSAYHDIRILMSNMVAEWRSRSGSAKEDNVARRIIRDAETERQRVAAYVRDAETALRYKSET